MHTGRRAHMLLMRCAVPESIPNCLTLTWTDGWTVSCRYPVSVTIHNLTSHVCTEYLCTAHHRARALHNSNHTHNARRRHHLTCGCGCMWLQCLRHDHKTKDPMAPRAAPGRAQRSRGVLVVGRVDLAFWVSGHTPMHHVKFPTNAPM